MRRRPAIAAALALIAATARAEDAKPAAAPNTPAAVVARLHKDLVRSVGFTADGKTLVTASFDGTVGLWDATTFHPQAIVRTGARAYWACVSRDRKFGVSGHADGVARLWDPANGTLHAEIKSHTAAAWAGALTPDGDRLATGGPDGRLILWKPVGLHPDRTLDRPGGVGWLAASPDGKAFAAALRTDISLVDAQSGAEVRRFGDHPGGMYDIRYSADGEWLATAGVDSTARVWRVADGAPSRVLAHFAQVHSVAFSPDGTTLATGGADYSVRLFDLASGIERAKLTGASDPVWGLAFSPDGTRLAAAVADGSVVVWEPRADGAPSGVSRHKTVDLRPTLARLGLGVVAQHARGTCSLHTMTRAIEFALSKREGRGVLLSDEYLNWATNQVIGNVGPTAVDRGQFFEHSWMGCMKHGICRREAMPWSERFDPGYAPSEAALADAQALRRVAFSWRDLTVAGLADADVVARVRAVLAAGFPVLAGSHHSLLVVGYTDASGGRFFVEDSGTGGFLDTVTGDRLHSAIPYARVSDYGFSWIEAHDPYPVVGEPK